VHSVVRSIGERDPWAEQMPKPQRLDPDLVKEGHEIPIARVQAMHEGRRRARRSSKPQRSTSTEAQGPESGRAR
jgi:hypothetical protein